MKENPKPLLPLPFYILPSSIFLHSQTLHRAYQTTSSLIFLDTRLLGRVIASKRHPKKVREDWVNAD